MASIKELISFLDASVSVYHAAENIILQGFRASHSTACLETVVPNGTFLN